MHTIQTSELCQATRDFSEAYGADISTQVETNSALLVHWLAYLNSYHRTRVADSLLDAFGSSIREATGSLSLGLVRQALFSFRGQVDLMLTWLYFKDHAVEWAYLNQTANRFKLKKEVLEYLEEYIPEFKRRMSILREISTRNQPDPYRLLSAHIHAQGNLVLPAIVDLKDLVRPKSVCRECTQVAFEVAEFLNDVLLAIYLPSWPSLPVLVQTELNKRFKSDKQRQDFFA